MKLKLPIEYKDYLQRKANKRKIGQYTTYMKAPKRPEMASVYSLLDNALYKIISLGLRDPGVLSLTVDITRSKARRVICRDYNFVSQEEIIVIIDKLSRISTEEIFKAKESAVSSSEVRFLKMLRYMSGNVELCEMDESETIEEFYCEIEEVLFFSMMFLNRHPEVESFVKERVKSSNININLLQGLLLEEVARMRAIGNSHFDKDSISRVMDIAPEISKMLKETFEKLPKSEKNKIE